MYNTEIVEWFQVDYECNSTVAMVCDVYPYIQNK